MNALALCGVWVGGGAAAALLRRLHRRRHVAVVPLAAAAAAALAGGSAWPGPLGGAHGLVLGREGAGLLVLSAASLALTLVLTPALDGGETLPLAVAGAATVLILGATSPLVWAAAVTAGIGALATRWLAAAPGRASLAAARIGGLGAVALVAAAPVLGPAGPSADARPPVAAALLAIGVLALLGVAPLGGWAVGCLAALRGVEVAGWAIGLAPAILLSSAVAAAALPPEVRSAFDPLVLVTGLAGALWSALNIARERGPQRYGRILLTDLALGAAVLGTGQASGRPALLLIILVHVCAAPLLLQPTHRGPSAPRRAAWLAVSGLPLTPSFWGRLLVLQACAGSGAAALAAGLGCSAIILVTSVGIVVGGDPGEPGERTSTIAGIGAWTVAAALAMLALAPQAITRLVFGGA